MQLLLYGNIEFPLTHCFFCVYMCVYIYFIVLRLSMHASFVLVNTIELFLLRTTHMYETAYATIQLLPARILYIFFAPPPKNSFALINAFGICCVCMTAGIFVIVRSHTIHGRIIVNEWMLCCLFSVAPNAHALHTLYYVLKCFHIRPITFYYLLFREQ